MSNAKQELQVVEDVLSQNHLVHHLGTLLPQSIHCLVEDREELRQQLALLLRQVGGYGTPTIR